MEIIVIFTFFHDFVDKWLSKKSRSFIPLVKQLIILHQLIKLTFHERLHGLIVSVICQLGWVTICKKKLLSNYII